MFDCFPGTRDTLLQDASGWVEDTVVLASFSCGLAPCLGRSVFRVLEVFSEGQMNSFPPETGLETQTESVFYRELSICNSLSKCFFSFVEREGGTDE